MGEQSHLQFRDSLKGQQVTIPSLYSLFPEWNNKLHKDYQRARDEVLNPWLKHWVKDAAKCRKLQMAELGVFAAVICADASFEKLCTAAKYWAWIFIWDDIFDCGSLSYDADGLGKYRQKSLEYFKYTLGGQGPRPDLTGFDKELQNALLCWDEVGVHIRQACSSSVLEIMLDRMLSYVASMDTVNSIWKEGNVPSVEEYWTRRELTAAVYPIIMIIPFIYDLNISKEDVDEDNMKSLWKHTSYLAHITNDMFSMRKEVDDEQIENLVPILMLQQGISCNDAMQLSYTLAQAEADRFRTTEGLLRNDKCDGTNSAVPIFISSCKDVVMGLVHWSYSGDRYLKGARINTDNSIMFEL
ncbi:Isoprenoid synthase domain containing protein [Elaphomyces granulatus]